jgi:hypothetical protein
VYWKESVLGKGIFSLAGPLAGGSANKLAGYTGKN